MASVLAPNPIFNGHDAVFEPDVLLDHLWLGNRLLQPVLSEDSNEIDCEYPAVPMQEEIVNSGFPQWCQLTLALLDHPSATVERIDAVWRVLSARHPCLRTILYTRSQDGKVYHQVLKRTASIRQAPDITNRHGSTGNEELDSQTAFMTILKRDEQVIMITLNIRLALVDVTSVGLLKIDFAMAYCGFPIRESTPMTAYLNHIQEGPKIEYAHEYWRTKFEGASITRMFPQASTLPPASSDKTHSISLMLESLDLQKLSDLETKKVCSRKCFFESLWAFVLSQHTGTQDVVFATSERDRSFEGYATYVGCLDQIYPVRIEFNEEQSFATLVASLEEFHHEASPHGHLGHESITKVLELPRAESLLKYSNTMGSPYIAGRSKNFPLVMFVNDYQPVKLTLFHTSKLNVKDAELVLQHYANAIRDTSSKIVTPDLRLDDIDLSSDAERNSIFECANNLKSSQRTRPSHIAKLFEEQVNSNPKAPAVQYEQSDPINFKELNCLANRLAATLQIKSRTFVPVCMDRSIDFVASLLAILKSGAAYIILDPEGALRRNEHIVEDCEAKIVLTDRRYASMFRQSCIVEDLQGFHDKNPDRLEYLDANKNFGVEDPCYVIYTSGSTGAPKGVVLTHRAATSGMSHFSLNGRGRWLLFYNPIFSAAQRTMMATLVKGGCLLLASKKSLTTSLGKTIASMKADALGITPSALSLLSPSEVPTLKQVTLVGEQVGQDLLDTWCERVELRNTFGLSECTQLNFGTRLSRGSNPRVVGRPSDTTRAYILKAGSIELAPLEVSGELCLAGPQLGNGYLKKSEQTAKVFIDNPFGHGKLYRTGDAARQHRDGSIEIVGRLDFQIKINGQRTEPSEINQALLKHSSVQACATVAALMGDNKSLVAAVVPTETGRFSDLVTELRRHVERLLPSYMIPSYWLLMEHLPTNANGKIDVPAIRSQAEHMGPKRLLELSQSNDPDEIPFTNDKEIVLRDVWTRVLQLDISAIHHGNSFISLGGSSLQAITTVTELRKSGLAVELAALVGSSSLDEIARSCISIASDMPDDPEPFAMIKEVTVRQRYEKDDNVSDAYPVTPLQEGLLAASLAGNPAYVYQCVWDMEGIDITTLRDALREVFESSDILRTTFEPHRKSYLQIVRNDMKLPWKTSSSHLAPYKKTVKEAGITPGQPLFSFTLIQERYLLESIHHSLFDFWSHRFLYQDIAAAYFGESIPERPPFVRFVKHVLDTDSSLADSFWQEHLNNASRSILNHAPTDEQVTIEKNIASDFKGSARNLGLTTGSIFYAAWAIVLSRHIGSQDVSFATTLSGRETPISDIARLNGPALTTVPQRIMIEPDIMALDFVKSVNSGLFQLMKHGQHGMRKALSAANQSSDYLDTLVNVLVKDQDDELSQKLFRRHGPKPTWTSEYTTLEVEELDAGFQLRLSTTMESRRVAYLLDSVVLAAESILNKPEVAVGLIDILGDHERNFLASKYRIEDGLRSVALLHERFEAFAATRPNAIAIDWDNDRMITYQDLDKHANSVAAHLNYHGIGRGDTVPLFLDKSIEMIAAIIGTMKAGAAYVPLSPDNPIDRNLYIVRDVGGQVMLTQSHYQEVWKDYLQVIDVADVIMPKKAGPKPSVDHSPDDIAYVIYTSGSTGNPKGVKVPHYAASTAVASMVEAEGRTKGEWRTLQFANYVFDASVQDIFNTLSSGGTLCMAPSEKLLSNLAATINDMDVNKAIITPTVAKLIKPEETPKLDTLIVGGEPLTSDVVQKWAPSRKLLNVYGPTETSMVVTTKGVSTDDNPHNIGKPFDTVAALIMNQDCTDLVPYGAIGELCVAGPQLSEGYVNNAQATSASFASCERLGINRMYRTGDLVRWLPGGDIECLGRKDNQVKIHGHRIELGEVEQAIVRTDTLKSTAVVASEVNHKTQLSALTVFDPTEKTEFEAPDAHRDDVKRLKEGLNSLPAYMVPKSVVPVGKLPTLPSGKVDRKLIKRWIEDMSAADLSKYSIDDIGPASVAVPVVTDQENILERSWSDILGHEPSHIGALANFFSLGGDSVSAINLVGSCRAAGYSLSVSHVLKNPVLREMATFLKEADAAKNSDTTIEFVIPESLTTQMKDFGLSITDDIDYTYPAPPGQTEFLNQGQRAEQFWVLMTIRPLAESTAVDRWINAVTELTKFNDILRTFYVKSGTDDEWIGVVLKRPVVEVSYHNCTDKDHRSKIIEEAWNERFSFGKPWIRYTIITSPNGSKEVVIKMDHAVYDGTLLRIFDAQFAAIQHGEPLPVHENFKDFALYMWRGDKTDSMKFWTELMVDKTFVYPAADEPRITAMISKPTNIGIDGFATRCSVTPSIVFQTTFQLWLMRTTGLRDVAFDYLLSGRNVELPNPQLINGNLANFLPFRSRLSESDDSSQPLSNYLGETQQLFWEVTENGDVGIDTIYDAAKINRKVLGNRALFLFQPFEPAASAPAESEMRWVVMKGSEVRMYQPYALVVEISKTVDGYQVKVMYDEGVFLKADAERIAMEQIEMMEKMVSEPELKVRDFLDRY